MRSEQLKVWPRGATREKYPDTRLWEMVSVTKLAFREGHIPMGLAWTIMVQIIKVGGYYREVGL